MCRSSSFKLFQRGGVHVGEILVFAAHAPAKIVGTGAAAAVSELVRARLSELVPDNTDWRWQLQHAVRTSAELATRIRLSEPESISPARR